MRKLRVASLFAGCGGTDVGLEGGFTYLGRNYHRNPIDIVYANDIDEAACDIFDANFSTKIHRGDIKNVPIEAIPDHDILTGGFPCQSFSIVAQNPLRLGVKDPDKGNLFAEMCRVLKGRQPLCFIAENVKGILTANNREAFPLILQAFRECGYHVVHILLNAYDYGVPQKRERVFIIGFRERSHMVNFCTPVPEAQRRVLGSVLIPEKDIEAKYYFTEKAIEGLKRSNPKMNKGRVQSLDGPCNTVGAHLAKVSLNSTDPVLCLDGRYRRFTPREVARIQSFPDSFKLIGSDGAQYRALGNAIPPVLAWHTAAAVIQAMELEKQPNGHLDSWTPKLEHVPYPLY